MVTMCEFLVWLIWSTIAASVVDFPGSRSVTRNQAAIFSGDAA